MGQEKPCVAIGRIFKAHGLNGDVILASYSEAEDVFPYDRVCFKDVRGRMLSRGVLHARPVKQGHFRIRFEDVEDRTAAEGLVGQEAFIFEEQLPAVSPGEYYWKDLMGIQVLTFAGECIGAVKSIFRTGAHDVYVVGSGEREVLVPAVDVFIREVDLERRVMTVDLPAGLADGDAL